MNDPAHQARGTHVMAELSGLDPELLNDEPFLRAALRTHLERAGATVCDVTTKWFEPQGVTLLALLAESHASIHTYPEHRAMFVDVFTCGEGADPLLALELLVRAFAPAQAVVRTVDRCIEPMRPEVQA